MSGIAALGNLRFNDLIGTLVSTGLSLTAANAIMNTLQNQGYAFASGTSGQILMIALVALGQWLIGGVLQRSLGV